MGAELTAAVKAAVPACEAVALGTNAIATAAMLKAGADCGATGENAVVVNCKNADIIVGPLGIIAADSLMGEVTPAMAAAVGSSQAKKILLPTSRCNYTVVGAAELPLAKAVALAAAKAAQFIKEAEKQ